MKYINHAGKKHRIQECLVFGTNFREKRIEVKFDEQKELIDRLIDLRILIDRGLRRYDRFIKYSLNLTSYNLTFYFKDEEEHPWVRLILDGFDLRCEDKKSVKNEFFKSTLFDLIREETGIKIFLRNHPNLRIRKKINQTLELPI